MKALRKVSDVAALSCIYRLLTKQQLVGSSPWLCISHAARIWPLHDNVVVTRYICWRMMKSREAHIDLYTFTCSWKSHFALNALQETSLSVTSERYCWTSFWSWASLCACLLWYLCWLYTGVLRVVMQAVSPLRKHISRRKSLVTLPLGKFAPTHISTLTIAGARFT